MFVYLFWLRLFPDGYCTTAIWCCLIHWDLRLTHHTVELRL